MAEEMKNKTMIQWLGGKFNMIDHILPYLNTEHRHYIEVFGGGASVLLNKKYSLMETYNDLNGGLVNLFRVIRDKEKFKEFKRLASLTLYSREEFYIFKKIYKEEKDDIKKAYMFYYIARTSFGGLFNSFGTTTTTSRKNMCKTTSSYLSAIDKLDFFHKRLKRVQIENQPWETILKRYNSKDSLFYIDPPYPKFTRKSGEYDCEMTNKNHRKLIRYLLKIKGKAIVSTYPNIIYNKLIKNGWGYKNIERNCCASSYGKTSTTKDKTDCSERNKRTEQLIFSPSFKVKTQKKTPIKKFLKGK